MISEPEKFIAYAADVDLETLSSDDLKQFYIDLGKTCEELDRIGEEKIVTVGRKKLREVAKKLLKLFGNPDFIP